MSLEFKNYCNAVSVILSMICDHTVTKNTCYIRSSDELLVQLSELKLGPEQCLVSLDDESLFTNVPIASTINIILNAVYEHPTIPPPNIQKQVLEQLLHICTSETPFKHNGQVYKQINGVSMGSPLGPTFADFYMSYVENYLLSQSNRISNPCFYIRYVDDIMAVFNSPNHVHYFINRLRNNSILNFTVEYAKNGKFAFFDVLMNIDDGGNITTSVYCKPTDKGVYCNYFSHTAEIYKRSVIKTLVFRALKYTSNWPLFQAEIVRLKLFCENNYPQHLVESIIQSSVTRIFRSSARKTLQ